MGQYDDFIYEVFKVLEEKQLKQKFFDQLEKMRWQDKHKYKNTRERHEYAFNKIIKMYEEDKVKSNLTF